MAGVTICAAAPCDAAEICAIANHYITKTAVTFNETVKTPQEVSNAIKTAADDNLPYLVAKDHAAVKGFATCAQFRKGSGYRFTFEHSIMVRSDAVGHGLGSALLHKLEQEALAVEAHSLVAGISAENPAAVAFHTRHGFVDAGRVAKAGFKFDRWIDLILLQKRLSSAQRTR